MKRPHAPTDWHRYTSGNVQSRPMSMPMSMSMSMSTSMSMSMSMPMYRSASDCSGHRRPPTTSAGLQIFWNFDSAWKEDGESHKLRMPCLTAGCPMCTSSTTTSAKCATSVRNGCRRNGKLGRNWMADWPTGQLACAQGGIIHREKRLAHHAIIINWEVMRIRIGMGGWPSSGGMRPCPSDPSRRWAMTMEQALINDGTSSDYRG